MEQIGKGILVLMLMAKSFSPSIGDRVPSAGSFVPDPNRPAILRIAVIPFDNVSADSNASERFMDTLVTYLLHTQIIGVVDPFLVEQQLLDLKLRKASQITVKTAKELKAALGVDAILVGKITAYQVDNTGGDSVPVIALSARLLDLETLGIVWSANVVRQGNDKSVLFDIGRINTLSDLNQLTAMDLASALGKQVKSALKGYIEKNGAARGATSTAVLPAVDLTVPGAGASAVGAFPEAVPAEGALPAPGAAAAPPAAPVEAATAPPLKNLQDMLPDVEGFQRAAVSIMAHPLPIAETVYRKGTTPFFIRLADCGSAAACEALRAETAGGQLQEGPQVNGEKAMQYKNKMGSLTYATVRGRILLSVTGGEASAADMGVLSKGILLVAGK